MFIYGIHWPIGTGIKTGHSGLTAQTQFSIEGYGTVKVIIDTYPWTIDKRRPQGGTPFEFMVNASYRKIILLNSRVLNLIGKHG